MPNIHTTAKITTISAGNVLQGKKIIVTGGGRGLGKAMAQKFISEGAEVLIAGRNEKTLQQTASDIGCKYLVLDVNDLNSFSSFLSKASEMLGGLNCLVNNAGISLHEPTFLDVTSEGWDAQFGTNLKGAFFLAQEFVRQTEHILDGQMKNVLFTSSETGETADERPYGLTKAAMNSLIQGLAYRYAKKGYRINAIAPGITTSDMTGGKADGDLTLNINMTNRFYLPEEVADIACFL